MLGALPLMDRGHREALTNATVPAKGFNRVTAVLTMNKPFELQPSMVASPVTPAEWAAVGVVQLQMAVEDFSRPTMAQYDECCSFIDRHATPATAVYVHCKAGRGRSSAVACCYLVHRGMEAGGALEYVASYRPHIDRTTQQIETIQAFADYRAEQRKGGLGPDSGAEVRVGGLWRVDAGGRVGFRLAPDSSLGKENHAERARHPPAQPSSLWRDVASPAVEGWVQVEGGLWLPSQYMDLVPEPMAGGAEAPHGACWKQRPRSGLWIERYLRVQGVSLLVYDSHTDYVSLASARRSSIADLRGGEATAGDEKFVLGGVFYAMTVRHKALEHFGGQARFCFQAQHDRDRFVEAVNNLAAGRAWDVSEPPAVE